MTLAVFCVALVTGPTHRYRESSILHLLDTLCMASHSEETWQVTVQSVLLGAYKVRANCHD